MVSTVCERGQFNSLNNDNNNKVINWMGMYGHRWYRSSLMGWSSF